MDFKKLKKELEKSTSRFQMVENALKEQAQSEVDALKSLLTYLMSALPVEYINGKQAVLIYVYEDSTKKTISNKVFFCEDDKIRYQVFKKDDYISYNPTVVFEGAYAVVDAVEHFSKRNGLELSDVVDFFLERVESLREMASEKNESIDIRKQYYDAFVKVAKEIF